MTDQIEKYLDQQMDAEEKALFEKELAENEALRQEMKAIAATREAIDQFQKHIIRQRLESYKKESDYPDDNGNNWGKYLLTIGVVLLLTFGGLWIWSSRNADALYAQAYNCACEGAATRGQAQSAPSLPIDPSLVSACELMKAEKYDEVISLMATAEGSKAMDKDLILALAYERMGDLQTARFHFSKANQCKGLVRNMTNNFESIWYQLFH